MSPYNFADDIGVPDLGPILRFNRIYPAVLRAVNNFAHAIAIDINQL